MPFSLSSLFNQTRFSSEELEFLLSLTGEEQQALHQKAYEVKVKNRGKTVYFRGLIEISNQCAKNCFYCGIRRENSFVHRYEMSEGEVLAAADFALKSRYGSIVIQGENAPIQPLFLKSPGSLKKSKPGRRAGWALP